MENYIKPLSCFHLVETLLALITELPQNWKYYMSIIQRSSFRFSGKKGGGNYTITCFSFTFIAPKIILALKQY